MDKNRMRDMTVILWGVALLAMLISLYAVFIFAPTERIMGDVQRIFYFHVSSAWIAFVAFAVVFVTSIFYLWKKERRWDMWAHASAEIGVLFTSLVLITGPLWAKPVWNTYWTWDPRLSTTLVLWLIYVAYLMLRSFAGEEERGARFAAVFGIIGFVDVPIVYMSIRWWRTLHPSHVLIMGGEESGLDPTMIITLMICLLAFSLLYANLLVLRVRLEKVKDEITELKRQSSL